MAAISGVFSNTVRGALAIAEAELVCKVVEREKIKDALEDMRSLLGPICIRHFNTRDGFKHIVGNLFPMLQRQTMDWLKQFRRRMSPRCSVKHPWQVIVEEKLPRELFDVFETIVSRTNFGVITSKTLKNCVFAFTSHNRVRKVFSDCTDQNLTQATFLKRKIKGNKRVEAIINDEKQFGMKYSYKKELMVIDFYYGYWNEHDWPQHV